MSIRLVPADAAVDLTGTITATRAARLAVQFRDGHGPTETRELLLERAPGSGVFPYLWKRQAQGEVFRGGQRGGRPPRWLVVGGA